MRTVQLTLGPLKLSIEPLPTGPSIEFTDYETDIAWLSGPLFVNVTITGARYSHIALQDAEWDLKDPSTIEISGRLDDIEIALACSLLDNPPRLEERATIGNPTEEDQCFEVIRIGPTWSPPKSWWQYWAYWRLMLIGRDFSPPDPIPSQPGAKLGALLESIRNREGECGALFMPIDEDGNSTGAIFTDEKRFLVIKAQERDSDNHLPLDLVDLKPSPTLIIGGIDQRSVGGRDTMLLSARSTRSIPPTVLIPGSGGWEEAFGVLKA